MRWLKILSLTLVTVNSVTNLQATELQPGIVVNKSEATVFLMQPQGGIVAINADSGVSLWVSRAADRPLVIRDNQLLAQANANTTGVIPLRYLDQQSGALIDSADVIVTETIMASVSDGLGQSFSIDTTVSNALSWSFEQQVAKGTSPSIEELLTSQDIEGVALNAINEVGSIDLSVTQLSDLVSVPGAFASQPIDVLTNRIPNVEGRQFLSADGAHILVSRPNDLSNVQARYQWTIFTSTGERLGTFNTVSAYSAFVVINSNAIFSTPEVSFQTSTGDIQNIPFSVRAVSLESNQQIWQTSVRDTRYQGPLPL